MSRHLTEATLKRVRKLEAEIELALNKVPVVTLAGNVTGPSNANRVVGLSGDSVTKLVTQDSGTSVFLLEGGTDGAPTTEYLFVMRTPNNTRGDFMLDLQGNPSFGTTNYVMSLGYNVNNTVPTVPTIRWSLETDFNDGLNHSIEIHGGQYSIPTGWNGLAVGYSGRPFEANALSNGVQNSGCGIHSPWPALTGAFHVEDSFDGFQPLVIDRNAATFRSSPGAFSSPTMKLITGENNAMAGIGFARADAAIRAYSGWAGSLGGGLVTGVAMFTGVSGTGMFIGRCDANFGNRREMISMDDGYNGIQLLSFGGAAPVTTDFGNGVGVLGLTKATTAPNANPAVGNWIIYSDPATGNLLGRSGAGNTRTIAAA